MVLDLIAITNTMKNYNVGKNYIILFNGTCIVTKSTNISSMISETNEYLSQLQPGKIDFFIKKLDKSKSLVHYSTKNIFNIIDTTKISNKGNTFLAILGRNQLMKDLVSPKVYAIVINDELQDDTTDFKMPRYREY